MTRALLIIDIQEEYFPDGHLPLHQAAETETQIVSAIHQARKAGDKIILIRHLSPAQSGLFVEGSPKSAIRPAILEAAGSVPIITKTFPDSFQETDLSHHLDGIKTLLICGMMTQNCVVFTALSESAAKFDVEIISNLCAAPSEIVHQIALKALGSKVNVRESHEIWNASPHG